MIDLGIKQQWFYKLFVTAVLDLYQRLLDSKSKSLLFPGGKQPMVSNDWCIIYD